MGSVTWTRKFNRSKNSKFRQRVRLLGEAPRGRKVGAETNRSGWDKDMNMRITRHKQAEFLKSSII